MPSAPSTKKANAAPATTISSRRLYSKSRLNIALKRGVESGKLVPVKGSFKLAAEEKKTAPKKPAAKPVAKKAAPAKSLPPRRPKNLLLRRPPIRPRNLLARKRRRKRQRRRPRNPPLKGH
ncbi:Winged helix-turn-helix DNA-binding domain [Phytophthora cactorum]|nr:Winged helix-turn-helix DNA-binding domain [Phytophthora cactorum]